MGKIKISYSGDGKNINHSLTDVALDKYESLINWIDYHSDEDIPSEWLDKYKIKDMCENEKLLLLIRKNHVDEIVTNKKLQKEFTKIFGKKIAASTISMSLLRFSERDYLERKRLKKQFLYFLPLNKLAVVDEFFEKYLIDI